MTQGLRAHQRQHADTAVGGQQRDAQKTLGPKLVAQLHGSVRIQRQIVDRDGTPALEDLGHERRLLEQHDLLPDSVERFPGRRLDNPAFHERMLQKQRRPVGTHQIGRAVHNPRQNLFERERAE